jgi:hypothetical protein
MNRSSPPTDTFEPWNQDRPDGWTVGQAIFAFAPVAARGSLSNYLARVDAGLQRPDDLEERNLWSYLRKRLQKGELVVRARQYGAAKIITVDPQLFDNATVSLSKNQIICNGITFGSVRIFPKDQVRPDGVAAHGASEDTTARHGSPIIDPSQAQVVADRRDWGIEPKFWQDIYDWLHDCKRKDPLAKRDIVIRDCALHFEVTNRTVRVAWDRLPREMRKPRRPK